VQVKHAQGDVDATYQYLKQVEQIVHSHAFPQFILSSIVHAITRIYLARGEIVSATRWAEASRIDMHTEPGVLHMFDFLTWARLLLVMRKLDETLALLARLREFAGAIAYTGILISALVLQALALQAKGLTAQAITTLAQALSQAEPEGYVRTFVDEGPPMADLLLKALKAQQKGRLAAFNFSADYVGKLLAAIQPDVADPNPLTTTGSIRRSVQPLLNPLSERELEVLRLIANGLSNQQIMQKLIVEKNTLKTHIRHLYRKLNVRSRTQAVMRASELNLL
jgi:LuxR family transcriptional regulator, maltose regulon positive regulatory protein